MSLSSHCRSRRCRSRSLVARATKKGCSKQLGGSGSNNLVDTAILRSFAASPSHRLLRRSNPFFVESIDVENSSAVNLPLPLPSSPRNWGKYKIYGTKHQILGSCRGLILLHNKTRYENYLILWNPSTGVHKRLSNLKFDSTEYYFLYGFGYDPSTDDYLIVLVGFLDEFDEEPYGVPNVHIFSFKTNSWEEDSVRVPNEIFHGKFRSGSLLNETLHWLVLCKNQNVPVVVAFDLMQRTVTESWSFSQIPLLDH
ncbi:F-box/kelch-repeat protein At3g06240-like [Glycine soja]|uniref:F-box/kelch-repeat protein At3g06240 n=1 Tax=Glycine max TaxID=3847 RepID=UPI0007191C85|nr:F-box/kelch-repeat protein At3g06240 [Glycine max]XP_028186184.1 F-box/kelch-repeat protein At3g06240-like [Glycine soja]|eukprot:XP_014626972.1 F-box/kelch-repeat protein At3g06240 [Glycine max]